MKEYGWSIEYVLNLTFPVFLNLFDLIKRSRADSAIDEFFKPYGAVKFGGALSQDLFKSRGSYYLSDSKQIKAKDYTPEELIQADKKLERLMNKYKCKLIEVIGS